MDKLIRKVQVLEEMEERLGDLLYQDTRLRSLGVVSITDRADADLHETDADIPASTTDWNSLALGNEPICEYANGWEYSASQLYVLYRKRQLSPVEIVKSCLERMSHQRHLNAAFTFDDPEMSIGQAQAAEKKLRDGTAGTLCGIPVAYKDNMCTNGVPTSAGSKLLRNYIPSFDADLVRLWQAQGAVMMGKTVLHEFAYGGSYESETGVLCRNPLDEERISGGSSAGAAAAVASGCVPISVGTDTVGSVRIPAAYCGLVGMKPTFGRIPAAGIVPLAPSLDTVGFLGRSVSDMKLALLASGIGAPSGISGADVYRNEPGEFAGSPVIGILPDYCMELLDPPIRTTFDHLIDEMSREGLRIELWDPPQDRWIRALESFIVLPEAAGVHRKRYRTDPEIYSEELRELFEHGFSVTADQYQSALWCRDRMYESMQYGLKRFDFILTPTVPGLPPTYAEYREHAKRIAAYIRIPSLFGLPAVSLPYRHPGSPLPMGIQLFASKFSDFRLIEWALHLERQHLS